jgi:putative nucleotide binding protein
MGRLPADKLTENAKIQLEEFIGTVVKEREEEFVNFFNEADAINTRVHQI